jgi:hypothetical protein
MEPSFEKLLALLAEAGVRFVVVDGVAVTLQGYVRLTEDLDILIDASEPNVSRLLSVLGGYGEGHSRELSLADFDDSEGAIRIVEETEQSQLDIFTRMAGYRYADIRADADAFPLQSHTIFYASKAALIRWKAASVREKDKLDAIALRRLQANPHALD